MSRQNLLFFIKNTKNNHSSASEGGDIPNLVLKKMLEFFLKIPSLKKILKFWDWKKTAKLIQKRKLQTWIKPMIENLKDELFQLQNKQARGAKPGANIR